MSNTCLVPPFHRRSAALPGLLSMLLVVSSCSGKPDMKEGFARVYGTVTLDEKPLPNAQVIFSTEQGESYGRTDSSGYYEVENTRTLKGAAIGKAVVKISTKVVFPDEETEGLEYDEESESHVKKELVPARYNTNSELSVEVTEDGAPYDFNLSSK